MADTLSSSKHKAILKIIIKEKLRDKIRAKEIAPVTNPRLFMLGGQPGAGKSKIRKAITDSPQGQGSMVIDPDELRTYHPKYVDFVKENPETAAGRVQTDAAKWAASLRAAALEAKVNIIYDGTLGGSPSGSVGMAKDAAKSGYQVEVHVVATSLDASQLGVQSRYEEAFEEYLEEQQDLREAYDDSDELQAKYKTFDAYAKVAAKNPPPRTVPDDIQKNAYKKLPDVIESLAKTGVVSRIRIADRGGKKLSDVNGKHAVKSDGGKSGSTSLKTERNRPWTEKEIEGFKLTQDQTKTRMENRRDGMTANTPPHAKLVAKLKKFDEKNDQILQNKKLDLNTDLRPKLDAWIETYTGFKIPKPKEDGEEDVLVNAPVSSRKRDEPFDI